MSDAVEVEVNVGGIRLGIAIRVLGGEIVSVHEANRRPQTSQGGQGAPRGYQGGRQQRPAVPARTPGPGRSRYGESIIDPLNAARAKYDLEGGRNARYIAKAMGANDIRLANVEDWLDANPDLDLEELMRRAVDVREQGGR